MLKLLSYAAYPFRQFTRKTILTLAILTLSRLGIFIPVLGIDHNEFQNSINNNNFINFLNIFSGGGFSTIGIFALGIVPYINASLIMQLLIKAVPQLENLQKEEGENGRQKLVQFTRYLTLAWGLIQSSTVAFWIKPYVFNWNFYFIVDTVVTLTSGSIIMLWFSELITDKGFGNGASLIIFQNIISSIPKTFNGLQININNGLDITKLCLISIVFTLTLIITILIQEGIRNIEIISARQLSQEWAVNIKNFLPLKLNQGGVMPIVFASAAMVLPRYLAGSLEHIQIKSLIIHMFSNSPFYLSIYLILVIVFSQLYSSLVMNPDDIAANLKKMGVSIPKVRPGRITSIYLQKILNRLTFVGSIFLFLIALVPSIIENITNFEVSRSFGATSLIILVGVSIDTGKQIQAYILSLKYKDIS
uniref:Protein translocase subunit SecY n=1 Tax=Hildenbrandia rivularis TaxID=135206 RepID=A0A1C9CFT9_9FLOR|nr:preprotein translocase subunit SecY [Hildenbrandia rivularis]AOM67227.1 preprotein translocase subunit SecY [Hildenbrandia rivularis]